LLRDKDKDSLVASAKKKRKRGKSQVSVQKGRRYVGNGAAETKSALHGKLLPVAPGGSERAKRLQTEKPLIPKEELAQEIATIVRYHHLTQTEAAQIVGDAASQVSLLMSGRIEGFSTERLLRMLLRLGRDIELVFRPATNPRAARFRITHKSTLRATG
jgi:predicted XRE-type DNA-binding protein